MREQGGHNPSRAAVLCDRDTGLSAWRGLSPAELMFDGSRWRSSRRVPRKRRHGSRTSLYRSRCAWQPGSTGESGRRGHDSGWESPGHRFGGRRAKIPPVRATANLNGNIQLPPKERPLCPDGYRTFSSRGYLHVGDRPQDGLQGYVPAGGPVCRLQSAGPPRRSPPPCAAYRGASQPRLEVAVDVQPILLSHLTAGFPVASTCSSVAPRPEQGHLDTVVIPQAFPAKSSVRNELKLLTDC